MLIAPPRRPKDKNQTKGTICQTSVVVGDVACVVAVTTKPVPLELYLEAKVDLVELKEV